MTSPGGPYLLEVVDQLWPGGRVSTGRLLSRPVASAPGAVSFFALPRASAPSMLIPADSREVTSTALREAKTGSTPHRRRLLRGLSVAARLGLASAFAERVTVVPGSSLPEDSLLSWLSDRLDQPLNISMSSSPPRANRKPVLHLIGDDGETVAFVKVGHNTLTRRLVRAEGEALLHLGTRPAPRIRTPAVLLHDQWEEMEILVLEPLVPSGAQGEHLPADLSDIMSGFARRGAVQSSDFASSSYLERLRRRIDGVLDAPGLNVAFRDDLDDISRRSDGRLLALGDGHGDFTPWNLARDGEGLIVWDWERFEQGVPLGFDALHYAFQLDVARGGIPAAKAAEGLFARSAGILAPFGVEPDVAELITALYLLDIGVRYSTDGQRLMRAPLARVEDWLLPALAARRSTRVG
ncbi:MAG: hypothetical protein ABI890_17870 [Lapillicoccus sp.]